MHVAAGFGKVAAFERVRVERTLPRDQVVYVGDGQSDIPVMLHLNRADGFTIAASEAREISQIAKRTVISDDALSVLVPILEEIVRFDTARICLSRPSVLDGASEGLEHPIRPPVPAFGDLRDRLRD